MGSAIDDLTEKEKEALRLLLAGHDAKSSASELDISVHTVNDRLRNARRKLDVSSSREAARILGDAEAPKPQIPAHTTFGIAVDETTGDNAVLNQKQPGDARRFAWLTGGMLIMSIAIAAALIAVVYSGGEETTASFEAAPDARTTSPQAASGEAANEASPAAISRARSFIAAIDAGNWSGSWDRAGEFFQSQTTAAEWAALVEPVRRPLGTVESRQLVSVQKAQTLPGAPAGDYEILQYQTKFSGLDNVATETVVLLRNGEGFDVSGYFIR